MRTHKCVCVIQEGYIVPTNTNVEPTTRGNLPKRLVFYDGRLVQRPTPFLALIMLLWMPMGFVLAVMSIAAGVFPMAWRYFLVRVVTKGKPPTPAQNKNGKRGVLFVCSHRTMLDPIFLSVALGRPVTAVTYSIFRLSHMIAPIKTAAFTRTERKMLPIFAGC
ncbi:unnamed protein product [Sphagnum troendelagicum]|uniref:Glycerol-3-phosphate acyltransferase n=1 Tax=Sphagnum troendelagicum TaxID=128251 RepID=A0ABP0UJE1_9BRYO